jgi:hypothetical protein
MNCFNHRDTPAIGLCKSCAKAICGDCVSERTNGLACKGSCETRVDMINRILDSNPQAMRAVRSQVKTSGVISLVVGIGFLIFAVWAYRERGSFLAYFIGLFGLATLVTGILRLSRRQEYPVADVKKD